MFGGKASIEKLERGSHAVIESCAASWTKCYHDAGMNERSPPKINTRHTYNIFLDLRGREAIRGTDNNETFNYTCFKMLEWQMTSL